MATKSATEVDKQVGARIRARREAMKVSQEKLGEALGITFQQIQKYEKGTNRVGASRLAQIAKTLDVPVSYFFDGLDSSGGASDLLADPQVAKLLSAFKAIENEAMRRAIVDLAVVASTGAGTSEETGSGTGSSRRKLGRGGEAKGS